METINLKRWNGQFDNPKVVQRIKNKIRRKTEMGICVLVLAGEAKGLQHKVAEEMGFGLHEEKLQFVYPRLS